MTKQALVEGFRGLSTDDKLDLLSRLWDEIAPVLENQPVTEGERRFLDDRLRDVEADTRPDRRWEDIRQGLLRGK